MTIKEFNIIISYFEDRDSPLWCGNKKKLIPNGGNKLSSF